jgi:hypothetical protein
VVRQNNYVYIDNELSFIWTWKNFNKYTFSGLVGATLSAGGFFFDYLGDYKKDRKSRNLKNPIYILFT